MATEVLVLGGGVAGCASAISLARKGRAVKLIERDAVARHKVCGEFLSGEALDDLHALGLDVASLGAVPIQRVRLAARGRAAEAPLPFAAASLTRKALDQALLARAAEVGVKVMTGRSVEGLARQADGSWQAMLDDGSVENTETVVLATGKHDIRGHLRPSDPHRWVAFKMYFRLSPEQQRELGDASELMIYPGGYCGLQPVEDGLANLCCVVQQKSFLRAGGRWPMFLAHMQRTCPHLAERLVGAEAQHPKPIAITHIPYGFLREQTEAGMYCVGDQAAVIPSFTGDGISVSLHTARCAAAAIVSGKEAPEFQRELRVALKAQMRLAEVAANCMTNPVGRAVLPAGLRVFPGVMSVTAKLTRVARGDAHPEPVFAE